MDRLDNAIEALILALRDTDEYKCYQKSKAEILAEELERINMYKCMRAEFISGGRNDADKSAQLYSRLMLNTRTRNYMLSEKKIYNMIADIYDRIGREFINK